MNIVDIEWHSYRIPFVNGFTTAHGLMPTREGAIVEVTTDQGITGIGEIAPLPEFAGSSLAEICKLLPTIAAYLRGKTVLEVLVGEPYVGAGEDGWWGGDPCGCPGWRISSPYHGGMDEDKRPTRASARPPLPSPPPLAPTHGVLYGLGRMDEDKRPTRASARPPLPSLPPLAPTYGALCGVETALLDVLGKSNGCSIGTVLAPVNSTSRPRIPVNAAVGVKAIRLAAEAARAAQNMGFGCVKLKVGMGENLQEEIERIAAVREVIGPEMHLRLDANEAWSLEEAIAILSHCIPYVIQYVEQPLKAHDLNGMHTLRQAVPIPIAADEAVHSLESARLVMEHAAADILVIKPQLVGGLRIGQQIIAEATEQGIQCVITSTIETGIGLTAALHLAAASPGVSLECGLATLSLLADDLLVDELPLHRGFLEVPGGPGLGVELDRKALEQWTTSSPIG
jgi:L-Ala-D/L-Glu epimerase